MDLGQLLAADMCIDLDCQDKGMAKQLLDMPQISAVIQHSRCGIMAIEMAGA